MILGSPVVPELVMMTAGPASGPAAGVGPVFSATIHTPSGVGFQMAGELAPQGESVTTAVRLSSRTRVAKSCGGAEGSRGATVAPAARAATKLAAMTTGSAMARPTGPRRPELCQQ